MIKIILNKQERETNVLPYCIHNGQSFGLEDSYYCIV